MNALVSSLTGFRWFERNSRGFELRLSWAEITGGLGFALALCSFEDHFSLHIRLGWPNIFIRLRFLDRWHHEPQEGMESWGFSWHTQDIHLNWGQFCKIFYWPWAWDWFRTSYLLDDGTLLHELRRDRPAINPKGSPYATNFDHWQSIREIRERRAWRETHPYRYVLRSGDVQERTATIEIHEAERRRRWLMWCPWFARVSRSIDIKFSDEVGERAGSWKGGCIGCGWDLLPGETPEQSLRRMERERKF